MIYFISIFLVLVDIFVFFWREHKFSFYIWTALWLRKYDVLYFSNDNTNEVSRDFVSVIPSSYVTNWLSLGSTDLWKWRYNVFDLSRDHVVDVSRDFVREISLS